MSVPELLDLMRRLPPQKTAENMSKLVECLGGPSSDVADEVLSSVDQPLRVLQDGSGRDFLACDFNRDSLGDEGEDADAASGDAYR
jgi:capping protein beta